MWKILLIDDCEDVGALIKCAFSSYLVEQTKSISEAQTYLQGANSYNLLLIDVNLPDGNGFDLCAKLNSEARHEKTPKIILTAKSETAEKVYGFSCGAHDYITKPFNMMELKARIDRFLPRTTAVGESVFSYPPFEFHLEFQKCYQLGGPQKADLRLTPTEFRLFLTLIRSEGRVLTRHELEHSVWKAHGITIEPRGVDTHIAHLRRKLKTSKKLIVSVYGQGYSFNRGQAA